LIGSSRGFGRALRENAHGASIDTGEAASHGFDPAYSVFLADFANAMLELGHPREAASFINARLAGDAKVLAHPKRSIT